MLLKVRGNGLGRWRAALRLIGVGWYVGICIVLGLVAGLWLDSRLNTKPILVIVGLVFGIFTAFYGTYRMLLPFTRNKRDKENS